VITDIRMPRLDGISAVAQICRERPIPAVILSAHYDEQSLQPLLDEHVFAFLIKPVRTSDLCAAIELAMERHRQFNLLLQQSDTLPQARADRRLVEQAKSLLQTRSGLSEVQAFDRLVVLAEQRQVRLVEIARLLHVVGEAFRPVPNE
jgi:response regulator NasT